MKTIYVVMGQSGDYSDHTNWPVRGFHDEKRAEAFSFDLTRRARVFDKVNKAGLLSPEFQALQNAVRYKNNPSPTEDQWQAIHAAREKISAEAHAAAGLKEIDPTYDGTECADYYVMAVAVEN